MWLTGKTLHEGNPLLLRRPAEIDIESLRHKFPRLAVITHYLEFVTPDGLPEQEYNDSLADFDHDIVTSIDSSVGSLVLIETFGGERHYYFYVSDNVDVSEPANLIMNRYPGTRLATFSKRDPEWKFLKKYAKKHF